MWHCAKCNGDFPECDYRYILRLYLQDHTEQLSSVTTFNAIATKLLGILAKDLSLLSNDP
jgi:replication factor A1